MSLSQTLSTYRLHIQAELLPGLEDWIGSKLSPRHEQLVSVLGMVRIEALLGAWPVMGFMGLDVFLLWYLFKRNYLDARRSETLLLTDRELIVDRKSPDGEREEHRLDAYWLKIELDEDRRLALTSRGQRVMIGRFLSPDEREHVAEQLKAALAEMRAPSYDHDRS